MREIGSEIVIYTFGTLYTKRVDLHKLFNRLSTYWTIKTFNTLEEMEIGWAKNIKIVLNYYGLTTNFQEIKAMHRPESSRKVMASIETKHHERLRDQCFKIVDGKLEPKTKTSSIIPVISTDKYKRQAQTTILKTSKQETRTIMIARYGLLECGKNFKGNMCTM